MRSERGWVRAFGRHLLGVAVVLVVANSSAIAVERPMPRGTEMAPPRARVASSISGVGQVTPPGCATGAYQVPFIAGSDGVGTWVMVRPVAVGVDCDAVTYGAAETFAGAWDPRIGGCLRAPSGTRWCLGPIPHRGVTDGVAFQWCPGIACWPGTATVART